MSKIRHAFASLVILGMAFGWQAQADPVAEVYVLTGHGMNETLKAADLTPYSDVILAFAHPDADGQLVNGDSLSCMAGPNHTIATAADLQSAIDLIHASGKRAIVSLGGAVIPPCAGDWAVLMDAAHRQASVQALSDFVDRFKLDGLDVDLESALLMQTVRDGNYTPFVVALSAAMHARGKTLSVATGSYVGGMIPLDSIPAFDHVGVMAYDNDTPGEEHASPADFKSQMYLWLGRGVPRDKLVMGLPFYGHGYGNYAMPQPYHDIAVNHAPDAGADVVGIACTTCSFITFNSPATIAAKTALAMRKAGGVMVWELWQDTPDHVLTQALAEGKKGVAPYPALAATPGADGGVLARFKAAQWSASGALMQRLADKTVRGGAAGRVSVPLTENPWEASAYLPITSGLKGSQPIEIGFWARVQADDVDTQFTLPVTVENASGATLMNGRVTVTTAWRWVSITGIMAADVAPGSADVRMMLGAAKKVVEVGNAEIVALK
ncbi:MAG: hypothetical protein JF571_09520 [Asticcacaulis sp.]|nr:hypothetical protein [Asticcacaulis sp.]